MYAGILQARLRSDYNPHGYADELPVTIYSLLSPSFGIKDVTNILYDTLGTKALLPWHIFTNKKHYDIFPHLTFYQKCIDKGQLAQFWRTRTHINVDGIIYSVVEECLDFVLVAIRGYKSTALTRADFERKCIEGHDP